MNIQQLFHDYNISYQTEGHKHTRSGWLNLPCPFCTGNPGLHLGFTIDGNHCYCWRCGYHPVNKVLAKLLNLHESEVPALVRQYGGRSHVHPEPEVRIGRRPFKFPSGTGVLQPSHIRYLTRRRFDPDQIKELWGVQGTGPVSLLSTGTKEDKHTIDFKHRIVIPITWDGRTVSFTARDITNRHGLRYISCPKDREIVHHKHVLYGRQDLWTDVGICVEGPTDVWRFGPSAFATFGIEYTVQQVRAIVRHFRTTLIAFDDDPQAQVQAQKLCAELRFLGVRSRVIKIEGDPGDMDQSEADDLVRSLLN